ncbi:hypothetical protein MC885_020088 [Smutsia gigantea]|nr:hypothetical protein MC885_020088 [Smutsia gigantea]
MNRPGPGQDCEDSWETDRKGTTAVLAAPTARVTGGVTAYVRNRHNKGFSRASSGSRDPQGIPETSTSAHP